MITIYTTPDCRGCIQTQKLFDRDGVPYESVDLSNNPKMVERLKKLGHQQAPVVMTSNAHWSGLQPDRIKEAIAYYQSDTDLHVSMSLEKSSPSVQ